MLDNYNNNSDRKKKNLSETISSEEKLKEKNKKIDSQTSKKIKLLNDFLDMSFTS